MDLKHSIQQDTWETIHKNYENESYSSAILDSIHMLTETIRNKTGLEGDGSNLIGQAFGGDNPRIQLNKLQTESEKNVQKGIQDILRGLFTAIRNPRSHDNHNDNKSEADAIIAFIDYLLKVIEKSKVKFEESIFLERVFEKYYVKSVEYSELLVSEIPKRQRANIAISVILKRKEGDIQKIGYFMKSLFDKLEENDVLNVFKVISEELKLANTDEDIRTMLHIVPGDNWNNIDEIVRLRIENLLLENLELGKVDLKTNNCLSGQLATWIQTEHLIYFRNVSDWTFQIVKKLDMSYEGREYINRYFWEKICEVNTYEIDFHLESYIREELNRNNEEVIEKIKNQISYEENHPWWEVFKEELKKHPDIKYIDDLPF
ncbi:TIGR02391 family protein [Paenibacillus sp. FSL R7-0331]|uniref:TIGR02391 family protein n=1 Tax=Paenibacillus sp. FSL R7-0331 TaxID=1536773 RepID=UPI0006941B98|nr:TIGR02391 family protein [Paenibacillus sp. FSL R7-0331]